MKIAFLWEYCGPYHLARFTAVAELHANVWLLELADQNLTYAWEHSEARSPKHIILFPGRIAERISAWEVFRRVQSWIKECGVDVLFVPSYWPASSFAAALAAKCGGARVVFMGDSHYASGTNTSVAITVKRQLMRVFDAALVAGSLHRSFLRNLGMPAEKIFDGYDSVDNDHFKRVSASACSNAEYARTRFQLPEKYILSLGRLISKKNLDAVIRAYSLLVSRGKHSGHDLVFVGSGPMQERLETLALNLGLAIKKHAGVRTTETSVKFKRPTVHFYPFAQVDSVPVFYSLATAFVLASTSDEWGLVVNEAMASGCPVIVSRSVGSSLDLVISELTGYRFVAGNIHELAWCMERMCGDPDSARRMGNAAQKHITGWSNERFARNAVSAAQAAVGCSNELSTPKEEQIQRSVWLQHVNFADNRIALWNALREKVEGGFHVFSGAGSFHVDDKANPDFTDWHSLVENRFLLGRRFLWQRGACEAMFQADVAILHLDPRILSNWVILAFRALWGAPTLLCGYAWEDDRSRMLSCVMRLYMMRLSAGTVLYSRAQFDFVSKTFVGLRVFSAPNAIGTPRGGFPTKEVSIDDLDTVVCVGNFNVRDNAVLTLAAFSRAAIPDSVVLRVTSNETNCADLMEIAQQFGIESRVQILGNVENHAILRGVYARAFCAVSAGACDAIGFQSIAFGVPLLLPAYERHAPEVEMCSSENSRYFPSGDAAALAVALGEMWTTRGEWLAKRTNIAKVAADGWNVGRMADAFMQAIQGVAGAGVWRTSAS